MRIIAFLFVLFALPQFSLAAPTTLRNQKNEAIGYLKIRKRVSSPNQQAQYFLEINIDNAQDGTREGDPNHISFHAVIPHMPNNNTPVAMTPNHLLRQNYAYNGANVTLTLDSSLLIIDISLDDVPIFNSMHGISLPIESTALQGQEVYLQQSMLLLVTQIQNENNNNGNNGWRNPIPQNLVIGHQIDDLNNNDVRSMYPALGRDSWFIPF